MKIFIVETYTYMYDASDSKVIVAETKEEAIAIGYTCDWGDLIPNDLYANEVDLSKKGEVHDSFNAG